VALGAFFFDLRNPSNPLQGVRIPVCGLQLSPALAGRRQSWERVPWASACGRFLAELAPIREKRNPLAYGELHRQFQLYRPRPFMWEFNLGRSIGHDLRLQGPTGGPSRS